MGKTLCINGTSPSYKAWGCQQQQALFSRPGTFWCKLTIMKTKKSLRKTPSLYLQLEDVVGCKWSVCVLQAVAEGVNRPGSLERHIEGISTKVLSERLRKLTHYGLLSKHVFAEVPPRVEYTLTDHGEKLSRIIEQIRALDGDIKAQA